MPHPTTPERKTFTRKFLLRLTTSPWTLVPVLGGATAMLAAWALGLDGAFAFLGSASVLSGVGIALTRLVMGDEGVAREVFEDMGDEAERSRRQALDRLHETLSQDDDPRDEQLLQDLRALAHMLQQPSFWPEGVSARSSLDIASGVQALFDGCVASLQRQHALSQLTRTMLTEQARVPIVQERERILEEVAQSIAQLSHVVARVQAMRGNVPGAPDLARVRQELDLSLDVAAKVASRISSWEREHHQVLE